MKLRGGNKNPVGIKPRSKMTPEQIKVKTEWLADKLGSEYSAAKEREKSIDSELAEKSSTIKALTRDPFVNVLSVGSRRLLVGKEYVVGIMIREGSSLDWERIKKLKPSLWKQVVTEAPDEKKLEQLVAAGKVKLEDLKKFILKVNKGDSVYVRTVEKANLKDDEDSFCED